MIINNARYISSEDIARKLNAYFANSASNFGGDEREKLETNSSKAIGLDGLGPRVLKAICSALSHSLTILVNKGIALGCLPDQLKLNLKEF